MKTPAPKRNFRASITLVQEWLSCSQPMLVRPSDVYGPFPITLSSWLGAMKSSMGYTGQMTRHVLHDSLSQVAGKNEKPNQKLKNAKVISFKGYARSWRQRATRHLKLNGTAVDQISKKKNLAGKIYKGWYLVGLVIRCKSCFAESIASSAKKGFDPSTGYDFKIHYGGGVI